jgi:hypothetical protein
MDDEKLTNQQIMVILDMILSYQRSMQERIDCIQHTICKNDDEKTSVAICKFLQSDFRNIKE